MNKVWQLLGPVSFLSLLFSGVGKHDGWAHTVYLLDKHPLTLYGTALTSIYICHRVQASPEDGLGGESTSKEWSLGPKEILRMVLDC